MIWVGTDDGNVQTTADGGKNWTNLTKNFRNISADSSVSHVEPSRFDANTAYVGFDRHKFDDYKPYVFKTTDGGKNFTNISGNLPANAYVHVVREDPKNLNLLYAGTELGLYASYDGGGNWMELNLKNLPRVAVHDIIVHPRDNDLILGTHGRSIYVFDDAAPIQQMNPNILQNDAFLFEMRPAYRFATRMTRYGIGDKAFRGQNSPNGAIVTYYLKDKPDEKMPVKMQVFDAADKMVVEYKNLPKEKGLTRTVWNLSQEGARLRRPPTPEQLEFAGPPRGPQVLPGTYTVKLFVGDKMQAERKVEVRVDPTVQVSDADLRMQYEMAMRLRDMVSVMNDGLRFLDSAKQQTEQIETVAKDRLAEVPADLTKALADYKKRVNDLLGELATAPEDGIRAPSRFSDQLSGLYFTISSGNFAPTATMRENYEMLQKEFPGKIALINRFIAEDTTRINQTLQKYGLSTIVAGKNIEAPM